jgi:hypothetical protein
MMRRLNHASIKYNKPIDKQVLVFDMSQLSYSVNITALQAFRQTLYIDQNYYPERLHIFFIINTPWFFSPLWSLIKPFIDPVTADKIHLLGNQDEYLPILRQYIDDSNIPPEFGGNMENFVWYWPFPEEHGCGAIH